MQTVLLKYKDQEELCVACNEIDVNISPEPKGKPRMRSFNLLYVAHGGRIRTLTALQRSVNPGVCRILFCNRPII